MRERPQSNSEYTSHSPSDSEHPGSGGAGAFCPHSRSSEEGVVLCDDDWCWADEEHASVTSFGPYRATGFCRTKEQRDETRSKQLAGLE